VTSTKLSSASQTKQSSQAIGNQRRNSRAITKVPIQSPQVNSSTAVVDQNDTITTTTTTTAATAAAATATATGGGGGGVGLNHHKLFAFESFDESIRRFQRLREIRKNLRSKYDDQSTQVRRIRPVLRP
jgi:hypothetical protein